MSDTCSCCNLTKVTIPIEIKNMEEGCLIKLAIDGNLWHRLFKCKVCDVFWEERYTGGRWDGWPELYKVSPEYVAEKWGQEHTR